MKKTKNRIWKGAVITYIGDDIRCRLRARSNGWHFVALKFEYLDKIALDTEKLADKSGPDLMESEKAAMDFSIKLAAEVFESVNFS